MHLYIAEGSGHVTEDIVKRCIEQYLRELNIEKEPEWDFEVIRSENGKPSFKSAPFHFSITHSGLLYMCGISKSNIGIDLEEAKKINYEKLSKRFYSEKDNHYVELWGIEGFYEMWVAKEAIIKYFGDTLAKGLKNFDISVDGDIKYELEIMGQKLFLKYIDIASEIKCAYVSSVEEELCIRAIN